MFRSNTELLPLSPLPYGAHGSVIDRIDLAPAMDSTPTPRARVLCFSRDRVLGESRRSVLQRRHDTVLVGCVEDIAALTLGAPFDVIVLCHTLSLQDCLACLDIVNHAWRAAGIISVASDVDRQARKFGTVVFGLEGPVALLNAVQHIFQSTSQA